MATNQDREPPPPYTAPAAREQRARPGAPAMNSAFDFDHRRRKTGLVLYKHWATLFYTVFFLALIVVPWIILNVLSVRPIGGTGLANATSWDVVDGSISEESVRTSQGLYRFATIANIIAALLTIPAISAVFNHAAVVLVQRRHPDQRVNALETLALADAPWSRLPYPSQPRLAFGPPRFTYGAVALVAVGLLQSLLQSALITPERIRVVTENDAPHSRIGGDYHDQRYGLIGRDAYPGTLSRVPINLVLSELTTRLGVDSGKGYQPRLWVEGPVDPRRSLSTTDRPHQLDEALVNGWKIYASVFPSNTDTGVLRYYAMRMNSSVHCEPMAKNLFPDTCPGSRPLHGSLSLPVGEPSGTGNDYVEPPITFRWCVPGAYDTSPWRLDRDRQNITEVLFIDVDKAVISDNRTYTPYFTGDSFTTRCSAKSTRGIFELPNYHNNYVAGPLLEKAPVVQRNSPTTNDYYKDDDLDSNPAWSYSGDRIYEYDQATPGPLTTTMLAMFGGGSWLYPVQNISADADVATLSAIYRGMCRSGIPLSKFSAYGPFSNRDYPCKLFYTTIYKDEGGNANQPTVPSDANTALNAVKEQVYGWFAAFAAVDRVNATLAAALYLANEATLTRATPDEVFGNELYASVGASLDVPHVSLAARVIVSLLLALEVAGLVGLLVYIYICHGGGPTFASRLDAFMVAAIGAQLVAAGAALPLLRDENGAGDGMNTGYFHLRQYDGVIGLSHGDYAADDDDGDVSSAAAAAASSGSGRERQRENNNNSSEVELNDLGNNDQPVPSNRVLIIGGTGSLAPTRSRRAKTRANAGSSAV